MYRRRLLFLFLLNAFSLFSERKVELVSNFHVPVEPLNAVFAERGEDIHVVTSNLNQYGIGLKRKQRGLEAFLHKWSLDFWRSIPIEKSVEKIILFNLNNYIRRDFRLGYLPKEKLILFMWEPKVVLPQMYKKSILERFYRIYTWDDDLVDGVTFFKMYYPVLQPMIADVVPFAQKKLCTLVASNLDSKRSGSLYAERKKAIAFFEAIQEEGFEFYGKKWDAAQYPSYRGVVDDKIATIKNYRFSICYENTCNRKGYVTEKIFDCFCAGNVPVYWGATNIETYIPKECFIDRRDFSSMEELYTFLKDMSAERYEAYLSHIRAFLQSEQAQLFSRAHFEELFFNAVTDKSAVLPRTTTMKSREK